jgi:hypothetical protein
VDDASSSNNAEPASSQQRPIPWSLTFDLRERETIWTDENKVQLWVPFECGFSTKGRESSALLSGEFLRSPRATSDSQARLVQLVAARELGVDQDIVSYRLRQLTLLLPDLSECGLSQLLLWRGLDGAGQDCLFPRH